VLQDDDLVHSALITQFGADQHHALPIWLIPINASSMVSFSIPPAHQGRRMQQATENPEYENEIQEAMNGPHPGRFQSIRAAATA